MKALIKDAKWQKEYESKFGVLHLHKVWYDEKTAYYSSKSKDQNKFVKGQEAEFNEIEKEGKNGKYYVIKPIYENKGQSNYARQQKREQSRYSGFAVSYAKDLVISGHVEFVDIYAVSSALFEHMVALDKTLQS